MKSLKSNYFFSILKSIMAFVFPMISFPYASRVLGVNNLGIVSYCTSVISYFSLFASLGIIIYATREGAKLRDDVEKLTVFCKEIYMINLISTMIVYAVFLIMLFFFTEEKYFLVMFMCSLSMWFTLFGVEWLYQIEEDFTYISIRSMVFQVISLILLFVLVKTKEDYIKYAFIQTFASGGSCVLNLINSRKYVNWRKHCKLELKKHLKPVFTIFGISAASSIYINLDTVMLKWFKSEYEVGLYTAAVKMNTMVKGVVNSLSVILLSRLSGYVSKKKDDEYFGLLRNGFGINLSIAIPCAVGMFMISRYIILIFSGADYLGAVDASRLLSVNLVFAIIDGMIYYQILLPYRMDVPACIGTAVGAVANIILNSLLIPRFSINGAALATILSELLVMLSFCLFLRKKIKVWKLLLEVPRILLAAVPIVLICIFVQQKMDSVISGCIISVIFSAVAYFAVLKLIHGVFAEELFRWMKQFLHRKDKA